MINEYIAKNKERFLTELIEFLKIQSISSDDEHKKDTERCADWVVNHLKTIGLEKVQLFPTKGHPIVYAEHLKAGTGKPTVLIYGHYDVQPVDPLELWNTEPFIPEIKNGKIWGRGTSDDKGQVFSQIKAVETLFKTKNELPVNIKFLIEGEEECGSSNLEDFIRTNKDMLKCDTIVISDTEWFAEGLPSICYGLRGICYVEVTVTGPAKDLHSGTYGGAVDNPLNTLCWMVAQLKDKYERITIPGFYDNVVELTEEERIELAKLPFNEKEYCREIGVKGINGEYGFTTLERVWARPSLDLNGIWGGFTGQGSKTVLPSVAKAKISMRLVPGQNSDDIAKKIKGYFAKIAPPTVKVECEYLHGGNPVLVPFNSNEIKAAQAALYKAFRTEPVFMREGGSIPIVEVFSNVLKSSTVLMGFGLPEDNIHSPNEHFSLDHFYGGIEAIAYYFEELAK